MSEDKRTAEEWGRLAVSLPGWRWMPGMLQWRTGPWMGSRRSVDSDYFDTGHEARVMGGDTWPDPDDPATEGCLLALLGARAVDVVCPAANGGRWAVSVSGPHHIGIGSTLGRACIAAAEALGRWPGGEG